MDPEPGLGKGLRIEVVDEERVESISLELRMDRPRKGGVMRDNHVGFRLLEKRELRQVQVVPFVDRYILVVDEVRKAGGLTPPGIIQTGPAGCDGEPDPADGDQVAQTLRE
jgi:hypothetical protein